MDTDFPTANRTLVFHTRSSLGNSARAGKAASVERLVIRKQASWGTRLVSLIQRGHSYYIDKIDKRHLD